MLNLSLFSQNINAENNILKLYILANQSKHISSPRIFCDSINLLLDLPIFHTTHMMGSSLLILTDNSCYQIADVFSTNKFICIDSPSRHSAKNVDFYSIEEFIDNKNYLEILINILSKQEYKNYVV